MPHIVVKVLEGMPVELKRGMAKDIAMAISQNLGLPYGMLAKEVEFVDIPLDNFAPALELTADNTPPPIRYVSISCLKGINVVYKRGVAKDVTEAIAKHLGIPPETEEIAIEIVEVNPENISHGGVLTSDLPYPPSRNKRE